MLGTLLSVGCWKRYNIIFDNKLRKQFEICLNTLQCSKSVFMSYKVMKVPFTVELVVRVDLQMTAEPILKPLKVLRPEDWISLLLHCLDVLECITLNMIVEFLI